MSDQRCSFFFELRLPLDARREGARSTWRGLRRAAVVGVAGINRWAFEWFSAPRRPIRAVPFLGASRVLPEAHGPKGSARGAKISARGVVLFVHLAETMLCLSLIASTKSRLRCGHVRLPKS